MRHFITQPIVKRAQLLQKPQAEMLDTLKYLYLEGDKLA